MRLRDICTRITHAQTLLLERLTAELRQAAGMALAGAKVRSDNAELLLRNAVGTALKREHQRVEAYAALAENYAPERLLKLGFAVVSAGGRTVRSATEVSVGNEVDLHLADGTLRVKVEEKRLKK